MLDRLKIGHYTDTERGTGCTVVLPPSGNVCAACAFGAAPGTRELALLSPDKKIQEIHALVLTGGSAFGLNAAHGVMEELAKDGIGFKTHYGLVPIVPAAVIFDKNIGSAQAYPAVEDAKKAYRQAQFNNKEMGNVGAGTGATVGKWAGMEYAMKAGLGLSEIAFEGIRVLALTVVNAVGDVLDEKGDILAGAVNHSGHFLAATGKERRWGAPKIGMGANTVLTAVFTNFNCSKTEAHFLAKRAHLAIARKIEPPHTSFDGDVSFVCCLPEKDVTIDLAATLVMNAVEQSIENGVMAAERLLGFRSIHEIRGRK
ncbi:P1 family peptidase [Calditrichota bacterium GD2]